MTTTTYAAAIADRDATVLAERAIAPAVAAARGYRTITAAEAPAYGFAGDQARAGLLIPCHNTQGFNGSYQLRPHTPRLNDAGKPVKYEYPAGAKLTIDVPLAAQPLLDDVAIPLLITESPIKADAIMSAAEPGTVAAIACVGVWGWRSGAPLSDFHDIPLCTKHGKKITARRRVVILFDSDAAYKPGPVSARQHLTAYLDRRGGAIEHVDIPDDPAGEKQGIDDALHTGATIAGLLATAHRPRPIDPQLVADDPDRQRIAQLEAKVAALEDELRTERAERADERRILGDSRRHPQERISAVFFNWNARCVAQHGSGKLGRGGGLSPVSAVDETGAVFTSVKGLAEAAGTSSKNMGEYLEKWHDEQVIDRLPVTRIRIGETVTADGVIKPLYESTARIRPRGNLGDFLHDLFMAAPPKKQRAKPQPKNICLDHPDARLIRRTTTECSICQTIVATASPAWVPAGTPPDITEHNAPIAFDDQNTPEVLSENAPQVISENEPCVVASSPPPLPIPHLGLFQESPIARAQEALRAADLVTPADRLARKELAAALNDLAVVHGRARKPDPKPKRPDTAIGDRP